MSTVTDQKHEKLLREARAFYAGLLAARAGSDDPRLRQAFEAVRREDFLPPGPWKIPVGGMGKGAFIETPSADPIHLYRNILIALDEDEGINNGEPTLHATWMAAAAPKPGEKVVHIGAGRGYYSAILSRLVAPGGGVIAFDINERLAAAAAEHLAGFDHVTVLHEDAVHADLPEAELIYVNAGVTAPPASWLRILRRGGRLVFPWRPSETIGRAVLVTRMEAGFKLGVLGPAWFIPCIGASDLETLGPAPDRDAIRLTRSIRLTSEGEPDETATAIYKDVWFSRDNVIA